MFAVVVALVVPVLRLRQEAAAAHEQERLVQSLALQTERISALAWRVQATGVVDRATGAQFAASRLAGEFAASALIDNAGLQAAELPGLFKAYADSVAAAFARAEGGVAPGDDAAYYSAGYASLRGAVEDVGVKARDVATDTRKRAGFSTLGLLALILGLAGGGAVVGLRLRRKDVLARAERRALLASEERFRSLIHHSVDMILILDASGKVTYESPAVARIMGLDERALMGRQVAELVDPQQVPAFREHLARCAAQPGATETLSLRCMTSSGHWLELDATLQNQQSVPGIDGIVLLARPVTEQRRFEAQLMHLANHDPLTGLFNRRRFDEELRQALHRARATAAGGSVFLLDLDAFPPSHDRIDPRVADEFLRGVAAVLADELDDIEIVARAGANQFAVLSSRTSDAAALAERLRVAVRRHRVASATGDVGRTASIGVALFPEHGATVDDLLTRADLALFQAKEDGDTWRVFDPAFDYQSDLTAHRLWSQRIREALEADGLVLYAQPVQHLRTGSREYEVLVRMVDEHGSPIPPAEFMGVAERSGLITEIDRWVLRQSIALLAREAARGGELYAAVNVSGRTLRDPALAEFIAHELREACVPAESLALEVAEAVAITDMESTAEFMRRLKNIGCRLAIDDFGAGFASFGYLKRLPIDYLKIDGAFIRNLAKTPPDRHFVRAMVEVARGLDVQVVAESVEDAETLSLLDLMGVDYVQGFHVAPVAPIGEVLEAFPPRRRRAA